MAPYRGKDRASRLAHTRIVRLIGSRRLQSARRSTHGNGRSNRRQSYGAGAYRAASAQNRERTQPDEPDEPDELQPAQPVWPDAYLDRAKELVTVEVNRSREEDIPGPSTDLTETGQRKDTGAEIAKRPNLDEVRTHRYSHGQSPMAAKSQRKAGSMRSVSKQASRCREISWKWKFTKTADQQRHSNSGRGHTTKQMRWNTS